MDTVAMIEEFDATFGRDGTGRVRECLEILAGERRAEIADDDQEATRIHFPGLAARAWHDPADFPWTGAVMARWQDIRAEYESLRAADTVFYPYEDQYTGDLGWKGWQTWHVYRQGVFAEAARRACPAAVEAVAGSPFGVREGIFSVLTPGTHLLPHTGGVNIVLTVHLPLVVPPDCALRAGRETRAWEAGKLVIFDDSFIHEAWNRSDRDRIVLLWDIWHPDLSPVEITALSWLAPRLQAYLKAH